MNLGTQEKVNTIHFVISTRLKNNVLIFIVETADCISDRWSATLRIYNLKIMKEIKIIK